MKRTYVYRLHVTYPAGSLETGWEPPHWADGDVTGPNGYRDQEAFRWPRIRAYLSMSGAAYLKRLLESYGATVTIARSLPVEWPGEPA